MVAKIEAILKNKNLSITNIRKEMLLMLCSSNAAYSQKEIEEKLEQTLHSVNRVTVYRNVRTLLEHNIIHPVSVESQQIKYKLIGDYNNAEHPHFYCLKCEKVICIPQYKLDESQIPNGFQVESSQITIEGFCSKCTPLKNNIKSK